VCEIEADTVDMKIDCSFAQQGDTGYQVLEELKNTKLKPAGARFHNSLSELHTDQSRVAAAARDSYS